MSRAVVHKIGAENRLSFVSEQEYQLFLQGRNAPPFELVGPQGERGNKGADGVGVAGNPGQDGESWTPIFGMPNGIAVLGDDARVPTERLPASWSLPAAAPPPGGYERIKSAAISLTASFSGSSARVTYSNLLHDEDGFVNPQAPIGTLKIPASYTQSVWVQPSYYFESNSSTGQRIASLVQVVNGTETVLTGYRNLLVANGMKGVSFRGSWLLAAPGTEFYVAYSNGTASQAMGIGAWFQIEVRSKS